MSRVISTRRGRSLVIVVILAALAVSAVSLEGRASSAIAPFVLRGALLTDTTLGSQTVIQQIDMVSPQLGYAIASRTNYSRNWLYLVKTTNEGQSWSVVADLPLPPFQGTMDFGSATLNFLTPAVGYVQNQNGPLYVTTDAGELWSKVLAPGIWPTFSVSRQDVFVVSDVCHGALPEYGPLQCPSELSTFALGATTASQSRIIPAASSVGTWRAASALVAPSQNSEVVAENDSQSGDHPALLSTSDGGRAWRTLSDPCGEVLASQILDVKGRWLLYCYLGGGMMQGTSELWSSSDQGSSWASVSRANEGANYRGSIGDVDQTLYANSGGTLLFSAIGGAAGGVAYSTDTGSHWKGVRLDHFSGGGAPEYLTTFATSGAIFGTVGGPHYRRVNATTWTPLPALPVGKYRGVSPCTTAQVTVRLGSMVAGVKAGTSTGPIIFTNTSNSGCYLEAIPTIQPLTRHHGPLPVPSARLTIGGRDGFVMLSAHGARASVVLEVLPISQFAHTYCYPVMMDALNIRFQPAPTFHVATPPIRICSENESTLNAGIVAGVVNHVQGS